MADSYVSMPDIGKNLPNWEELIKLGLKRGALHLIARAKALAPEDTTTLVQSIHSSGQPVRSGDVIRVEVGAHAQSNEENYGVKVHEDQVYDGPNVGGTNSLGLGPKTEAKGVSAVEPTDGSAGGKYMTRPIANKPEVYAEIIGNTIREALEGGDAAKVGKRT